MRQIIGLACSTIIALASWAVADETAQVDAASAAGMRVSAQVDPVDPSWVKCTIDWLRPSDTATLSVHGPATVVTTTQTGSEAKAAGRWSTEGFRVAAGDQSELLLSLRPNDSSQPVMVLVERKDGPVIFQAGVSLDFDGATTAASEQTSYRIRHEDLDESRGAVIIDHLGPATATKAQIFAEDGTDRPIPDGPTDCGSMSTIWPRTVFLDVTSAPPAATATDVTVHLTVNHPVMADMQIVFSKEFFTVARYLWLNGPGTNIDQDFNRDVFNHTLPGVGEPVNGTWVLALRDCDAGNTGVLDYWSVRIDYTAATSIDLVADSLSVDPGTVEPGDTVEVDWAGHVSGTGTVGAPFAIDFFLSSDTNITAGDTFLGEVVESTANDPGDNFGEASPGRTLTIPGGTSDGTYYLGMIVDIDDFITESNEANNIAWAQIDVSTPMTSIDLVADSVSTGAASVEAGNNIQVSYSGHATGLSTISGSFSLGFYLSADATVTAGDQLLAQRVGAWATTGGDTFGGTNYSVPIPASTAPGTYYLGFWVDDTGVVAESNEANNTALHYPLTVTGGGGGGGGGGGSQANLTAMPCSVTPITVEAGDQVAVNWRAFNTGETGTGQFRWGIYISNDSTITPGTDTRIKQQTEPNWPIGHDSGNRQTDVAISAGLADGLYYIGLMLDDLDEVGESNEADNICTAQLQVGSAVAPATVTRWLVPAAASAPGFGTSNWKTQISVVNPLNATRTASLYFVANGAPWPGVLLSGPISIGPTDRAFFDDVLATLNPAAGLPYVVLDQHGPVVTSRTYNLEPGGATFGQGIPAIPFEGITPPDEVVLPMVHTDPGLFHTNLGIVHAAGGNLQVQVQVYNASGVLIGTKNYNHFAAWRQINDLYSDMGLGNQIIYGGWIRVTRTGGTGYWTCYASVVDDLTNDPTYIAPMEVVE